MITTDRLIILPSSDKVAQFGQHANFKPSHLAVSSSGNLHGPPGWINTYSHFGQAIGIYRIPSIGFRPDGFSASIAATAQDDAASVAPWTSSRSCFRASQTPLIGG
ncbi:hypothetical protein BO78DRAFT_147381 [Aspergillus sclerotiicarbonarius CBS 121057]|uniref:Uncharacterized protein n=1 Tax=Aspergillus sclerotiicarbonarius (strain CBS 121057 / IBT 28362) TaxID=1448318 RepID=A0A319E7K4_ASPSB|nr:hypothetical protein BO78DRAFT_147381 [Aspergillus sclerotiicarbonarius CBS 121057]